ncbi:NACHT domain-containing protein [Streptomyces sp. NPDC001858]
MGVHRETLYRRLRTLRTDAETAYRERHGVGGFQAPLERAVRRTGLPGTALFEGKVASRWAPQRLERFSTPRSDSVEQVLAVIAVWESWTSIRTLGTDGRIRQAWLASEACKDWRRLLEAAQREIADARRRAQASSGKEAEVDAAVARYFERLVQTCGRLNLDVLGPGERAGEQPAIRLRQVFEVPLISWDPPKPELPAPLWQELVERGEVSAEDLPPGLHTEQVAAWRTSRVERPPVPVVEAVASSQGRRLVLLGDPGAGKSTLSRYLALALAGGLEEVPAELKDLVEAGTVPVVVELRHLADGERWRGRTVEDFWGEFDATERMGLPRDAFECLLERAPRPVLVVFDGLDEIFDPARRAEVARQVAAFAEVHEHVRVILTSRVVGFAPGVFAAADFSQAKLEDLPRRQIESFIRRWYTAAHPADPGEAARLSERLISAVWGFASVAELAGNPLLLTILASIGLGATIPRDRREVYRHAVDVLTGRWDRDAKHLSLPRQAHPDVAAAIDELDSGLLQELLERLARHLQASAGSAEGSTLIARTDLTTMIAEYVIDMNYPPHVGRIVAHAMVERLHHRAFLLHPYGAGMYGFVHRTFLEYLAARDLSQRYSSREWTPEQLIDMLAERALSPVWHEVILLFMGQISRQAEAEHATFIARLLRMHRRRNTTVYSRAGGDSEFMEFAIRVLAEAHRIPRAPSEPGDHPERSLAIQSDAVIDTLTAHLSNHSWAVLDGAVPALMSFPWSWSGRERYQRWHRTEIPSDTGRTKDVVAASLCRTPQEASHLARIPWGGRTPTAAVRVLGERWPDREDAYAAVLETARDPNASTSARDVAVEVLGERWPDRETTYTTILDAARNVHSVSRDVAVRVLAERWPEREEAYTAVLDTARDPDAGGFARSAALRVLGKRWPDREDVYTAVLDSIRDPNASTNARDVAVHVLGKRWPDREDAYTTILDTARNIDSVSCHVAMRVLGEQWPDREDAYAAVLDTARNTHSSSRDVALQVLGERWPEREEAYAAVLDTARDSDAGDFARSAALQVLGERWPDREDAYAAVLDTARDPDASTNARSMVVQVLGERWPEREEAYTAVLDTARDPDASTNARSVVVQVLGERWPDREATYIAVLDTARDPNAGDFARSAAVRVLGERWPDREATYTTILGIQSTCRDVAVQVLGEWWPEREDAYAAVLDTARDPNAGTNARSAAVRVLGERWPDREDAYGIILETARDPNASTNARYAAFRVLAQRWPERRDAWNCAARGVKESSSEMRGTWVKLLVLVWPELQKTEDLLRQMIEEYPNDILATCALSYVVATKGVAEI